MFLRRRPSKAPVFLALSMLVLVPDSAASADYRQSYQQALQAMETESWSVMEHLLRSAIEEHPQSSGGRLRRARGYFPHYFLGIALQEQGECSPAAVSWAEEIRQGILTRSAPSLKTDLDSRGRRCAATLLTLAELSEEARRLLEDSRALADQLSGRRRDPQLADRWQSGEVPLSDRFVELTVRLEPIGRTLASEARTIPLHRALLEIRSVREGLLDIESQLSISPPSPPSSPDAASEAQAALLEEARGEARALLAAQMEEMLGYPTIADASRKLATVLAESERAGSPSAEEAVDLVERLSAAARTLERATSPPPDQLANAAAAFVIGNYEEVLDLLEDTSRWTAFRSRAHICLLRSASLHNLFLRSGETRQELLEEASELLAHCPFLENHVSLSPDLLSPGFLDLYRIIRQDNAQR